GPDQFPVVVGPVVVLPEETAFEEVAAQRRDLLWREIVVRSALHLEERTMEEIPILERDLAESGVVVRPPPHPDLGELLEAGQEIEIRGWVIVPPSALALHARARVAQATERETALDIGESGVHRRVSLPRVPHDDDLRGSRTERQRAGDREEQGG